MDDVQSRDWLTKEEAEVFIGKNADFYLDKWNSHPNSFYKGWNWAATIFRVEWMAYRKMYVEAIIVVFSVLIFGLLIGGLFDLLQLSLPDGLVRLLVQVLVGAFANSLYRKKAIRVLHQTSQMDEAQRMYHLSEKGGTSILGLIILLVIEIAIFAVPLILSGNI